MKDIFRPRKGLAENVAFLSLFAAIDAVLALLMSFVPLSSLFVIVFLPGVSSFASFLAEKKYLPVYAVGASLLSVAFSFHDLGSALFYVVPAVLSGTLLGLFVSKDYDFGLAIFAAAFLNTGFAYLSLPISKALTGIDFVEFALVLLGISEKEGVYEIIPSFFFAYGAAASSLSAFFVSYLSKRFMGEKKKESRVGELLSPGLSLLLAAIGLALSWTSVLFSLLLFSMALFLAFMGAPSLFRKNPWWVFALLVVLEFGALFLFAYLVDGGIGLDSAAKLSLFLLPFSFLSLVSAALPYLGQGTKMGRGKK